MLQPTDILGSKKGMKILSFLLNNPDLEMYQTQIIEKIGFSKVTTIKWLNSLCKKQILKSEIKGKIKFYKIDMENPIVKQLKILMNTTKLYEVFSELKRENVEVYLYGSVARGEDTTKSDVDILVMGKIDRRKIVRIVERAKKAMKREVKPLILNPLEYTSLIKKDRIFYENVEKNKIRLV